MTVYMPPIERKKKVPEKYNPDTFRVISTQAEDSHPKFDPQPYKRSFQLETPQERLFPDIDCGRTRVLPRALPDYRHNNPQTKQLGFIRTNVRLLNEPVCAVYSKETHSAQHQWWPSRANEGDLHKSDYTRDTIYRNDFMYTKKLAPQPSSRHSANPNTTPVTGIAPVNFLHEKDGQQRFYKEGLSYEHQYNSRADPNYPIRGKRHGAFVWDKMKPDATQRFIDYHSQLDQVEKNVTENKASSPPPQRASKPASAHQILESNPQPSSPIVVKPTEPAPSPQKPSSPTATKEE